MEALIANVRTTLHLAQVNGKVLPVSVNHAEWDNSYVASPFTHYISYCRFELYHLGFPPLEWLLGAVLAGIGLALRACSLNRVAQLNNFLLSTNLYPDLSEQEILSLRNLTIESFPDHALVFRSINDHPCSLPGTRFRAAGFFPVASRQLYVQDPASRRVRATKAYRQDSALARESPCRMAGPASLRPVEYPRVAELYRLLYLEKYSHLNPQITVEFVRWAHESGFLQIHTLRKGETIVGVAGYYRRGGFLTCPLFGYDTTLPQAEGLYRLLSLFLIEEAGRLGVLLNASSGAANFKRSRGGEAFSEFSYVYTRHLPWHRRAAWWFLSALANRIVLPILRKLRL